MQSRSTSLLYGRDSGGGPTPFVAALAASEDPPEAMMKAISERQTAASEIDRQITTATGGRADSPSGDCRATANVYLGAVPEPAATAGRFLLRVQSDGNCVALGADCRSL